MRHAGEIAALLTACCWSTNSVLFSLAGRRVGSPTVNIARLAWALIAMVALHVVLLGSPFPFWAEPWRFGWLGISGLIGFALGDAVLFEALVRLGPRLAMLVMTLWPVFATILAWIFLGERLSLGRLGAMGLTLGGIAWVVAEKDGRTEEGHRAHWVSGVLLAIGGGRGSGHGLSAVTLGVGGRIPPHQRQPGARPRRVPRVERLDGPAWLVDSQSPSFEGSHGRLDDRPGGRSGPRGWGRAEPLRSNPSTPGRRGHPHVPFARDPAPRVGLALPRKGDPALSAWNPRDPRGGGRTVPDGLRARTHREHAVPLARRVTGGVGNSTRLEVPA